jgi:hypothetical protein
VADHLGAERLAALAQHDGSFIHLIRCALHSPAQPLQLGSAMLGIGARFYHD